MRRVQIAWDHPAPAPVEYRVEVRVQRRKGLPAPFERPVRYDGSACVAPIPGNQKIKVRVWAIDGTGATSDPATVRQYDGR